MLAGAKRCRSTIVKKTMEKIYFDDVRKKKAELDDEIYKLIKAFEESTGCYVYSVDTRGADVTDMGEQPRFITTKTTVIL